MEIQVSLKVRSAIKAKLVELGLHVDEELPDYVMVLVANRRTKPQMEQDLQLFLGDNTAKFTTWLLHVLSKLEELTNSSSSSLITPPKINPVPSSGSSEKISKKKKDEPETKKKKKEVVKEKEKIKEKEKSSSSSSRSSSSKSKHKEPENKTENTNSKIDKSNKKTVWLDCSFPVDISPKRKKESEAGSKPSKVPTKRKIQEEQGTNLKEKKVKAAEKTSSLTFKLKRPELKSKLPSKSTFTAAESPRKHALPLLNKSPVHEIEDKVENLEAEKEKEFKIPQKSNSAKKRSHAVTAETSMEEDVLNLNEADADDFLKDDKEKEELVILRKSALESKRNSRTNSNSTNKSSTIGERIIDAQKKLDQKIKLEKRKLEQKQKETEAEAENSKQEERKGEVEESDRDVSQGAAEKNENDSTNRKVESPTKRRLEINNNVGSRIRELILSHKENNSRSDAREILRRRELERNERVPRKPKLTRRISRSRSHERSRSRSRSRSPSPEIKKIKSAVGAIVKHDKYYDSDEEDALPNAKLSSVIHVTARPKREKEPSKTLLFRAVKDAQKSVVRDSDSHRRESRNRTLSRSRSRERVPRDREFGISSIKRRLGNNGDFRRRYDDEYDSRRGRLRHDDYEHEPVSRVRDDKVHRRTLLIEPAKRNSSARDNEQVVPTVPVRKSVHERLGVKRTNYFDEFRTQQIQNHFAREPQTTQNFEIVEGIKGQGYEDLKDDDIIVISVPSSSATRNVSLESLKDRPRPRISIQLRDDDSTDEEEYDPVKATLQAKGAAFHQKSSMEHKSESETDYIVEEIVEEETDDEIEVTIGDTSLKLPEPVCEMENENSQSSQQSDPKDSEAEREQKQQMLLLSEQEIAEIMAKGPEIRLPTKAELNTSAESEKSVSVSTSSTIINTNISEERKPLLSTRLGPPPIRMNSVTTTQCKFWPNCTFKDKCIFTHPKCKFDDHCKNANCAYKHSSIRNLASGIQIQTSKPEIQQCKFFPSCHSLNCPFFHPTPCKFGLGCNDDKCKNYHPGETRGQKSKKNLSTIVSGGLIKKKPLPATHLLKWTKSGV